VLAALGSVYPPGYPLLIAVVFPFVGHWELAGEPFSGSRGLMAHCAVLDLFRITEAQRPLRIPGVGTDSYLGAILKKQGHFVVGVEQDAILADKARQYCDLFHVANIEDRRTDARQCAVFSRP